MAKWKVLLGLSLLFCSGAVVGGLGVFVYTRSAVVRVLEGGPTTARTFIMKKLTHDLVLRDDQRAAVEQQVARIQQQILKTRLQSQPEVLAAVAEGVVQMKSNLSLEQQEQLDILHRRLQDRLQVREQWQEELSSFIIPGHEDGQIPTDTR